MDNPYTAESDNDLHAFLYRSPRFFRSSLGCLVKIKGDEIMNHSRPKVFLIGSLAGIICRFACGMHGTMYLVPWQDMEAFYNRSPPD